MTVPLPREPEEQEDEEQEEYDLDIARSFMEDGYVWD